MTDKKKKLTVWQRRSALLGAVFVGAIVLIVAGSLVYEKIYYGRVYPITYLGQRNVSGLAAEDLRRLIDRRNNDLNNGINICLAGDCLNIKSATGSLSAMPVDLFDLDGERTFNETFNYGRAGDFGQNIWDRLTGLIVARQLKFVARLDKEGVREVLKNYFTYSVKEVKDADINVTKDGALLLTAETDGWQPDYEQAIDDLENNLLAGRADKINLKIIKIKPTVNQAEVTDLNGQADRLLAMAPITWHYQDKSFVANRNQAKQWLGLALDQTGKPEVIFSKNKLQKYVEEKIAPQVTVKLVEPKFRIMDGRVYVDEPAQDGLEINYDNTIINFFAALAQDNADVDLAMQKSVSQNMELSGLDSVEIVGVGTSSFSGSPANRRHNIAVGASAINGILIKSGEEFSLIRALGKIDGAHGYLQELVIKDNKTLPEFGGGLCQIGTTLFRAVVDAGLPVTMRRNHSYRVAYYEPAGTDATIYDPQPDFRFINDTGKQLLLQTKISGNQATFTFWGARDGRQVYHAKPTIYNIVKPGPTKLIESPDMKPGEKKCTEKAHNGADAYFDYQVTYPSGEVKKVRFSSHYVPWREVCLIGATSTTAGLPPVDPNQIIIQTNIDSSKVDAVTSAGKN